MLTYLCGGHHIYFDEIWFICIHVSVHQNQCGVLLKGSCQTKSSFGK